MPRPRVGARWLATAAALLIAGCVVTGDRNPVLASAESVQAGTPAPTTLAGTHRIEIVGSAPQFDGTLTGTRTLTEVAGGTGPCAGSGGIYETPVLLTHVPDASK